jgi:hypothetical protein
MEQFALAAQEHLEMPRLVETELVPVVQEPVSDVVPAIQPGRVAAQEWATQSPGAQAAPVLNNILSYFRIQIEINKS